MSPTKCNTNDVAYLVRQGQQEVVEEDGGDGDYVILVVITSHQSVTKTAKIDAHLH